MNKTKTDKIGLLEEDAQRQNYTASLQSRMYCTRWYRIIFKLARDFFESICWIALMPSSLENRF